MAALSILHTGNVEHDDKMTEASAHDKQMKDLVGTKEAVSCIEERKFQCVDNSPNGIDNSSAVGRDATRGAMARTQSHPMEI